MLRPLRVDAGGVSARPYEDRLGRRLMITCQALGLTLQGCVNETDNGPVTNVSTISHSSLTLLSLTHSLSLSHTHTHTLSSQDSVKHHINHHSLIHSFFISVFLYLSFSHTHTHTHTLYQARTVFS